MGLDFFGQCLCVNIRRFEVLLQGFQWPLEQQIFDTFEACYVQVCFVTSLTPAFVHPKAPRLGAIFNTTLGPPGARAFLHP